MTHTDRPQVLLLGNGINRAFGGGSWGQLIRDISCNPELPPECVLHLPMPLRAILVTGDTVLERLGEAGAILYGKLGDPGHGELLRALLELRFDHILTTNFSYEAEMAAQPDYRVTDELLLRLQRCSDAAESPERRYLLHTWEEISWNGWQTPLWHIHGEGREPESIILGHYHYASLLERVSAAVRREEMRYSRERDDGALPRIRSWADAFLFGDVYVLGFGFDVSEFDLWWLLNRKKREAGAGRTWFFSPEKPPAPGSINEKEALLKVLGAEIRHCGAQRVIAPDPILRSGGFRLFYLRAMEEIRALMAAARAGETPPEEPEYD